MKRLIRLRFKNLIFISALISCGPVYAQPAGVQPQGAPAAGALPNGAQAAGTQPNGAQAAGGRANDAPAGDDSAREAQEAKSIYDDASLTPRDIYNLAIGELGKGAFDSAADGFARARDAASFDNELRYAAAYNLGFAYAAKAAAAGDPENLGEADLQAAIDDLSLSIAWFRDAARQRPSLDDARGNLEIVLKRHLNAQDIMAQKYNTPERRLDALIAAERDIREASRALSQKIGGDDAARNPIAFRDDFKSIAKMQREALTDANLTAENIANARALIESKTEDARSQEEAYRKFQFDAVIPLLDDARRYMASARRQMRDMSMADGLRQTNKAFYALKQAREQLDEPLRILTHVFEDEQNFIRLADAKALFESPERLSAYREKHQEADIALPAWLNATLLSDTQQDVLERTKRLAAFLDAASSVEIPETDANGQPMDKTQKEAAQEQRDQIRESLPLIRSAAEAMSQADEAVNRGDAASALREGAQAARDLSLAMERFADLKHLIEIAYRSQSDASAIVSGDIGADAPELLSREQQKTALTPILEANSDRLERLSASIAKQSAKALEAANKQAQAADRQAAAQGAAADDQTKAQAEAQIAQMQQLFEHAETLRADAQAAVKRMSETVAAADSQDETLRAAPQNAQDAVWSDLTEDSAAANANLEQLRMLFFTIAEHVEELLRQQTATLDATADVSALSADEQNFKLPPVIDRQRMHELTSTQLSRVIAEQSEKMAAQGGQDEQETAQRYRQAAGELDDAAAAMRQAQADLQNENRLFAEALAQQKEAAEHVQKALEWLRPPQQQNEQQQQQQQNDQQQQQQQQQQKMSKEQAEKKIQQIRSRDQERRKHRESRQDGAGMPVVEKDW